MAVPTNTIDKALDSSIGFNLRGINIIHAKQVLDMMKCIKIFHAGLNRLNDLKAIILL